MSATITSDGWSTAPAALAANADRFLALAGSVRPDTMATADWTVTDTLAHLVSLAWYYVRLVDPASEPLPIPGLDEQLPLVTVDTVADANDLVLRHLTDRDPARLLDRLRGDVDRLLARCADRGPDEVVPWLGDARVPLAGLLAHLVNELLVHGHDIARAARRPWTLPPRDAALFLELFMAGVVRHGYGRLLDGVNPPRRPRIVVRFTSAWSAPLTLTMDHGRVRFAEPAERPDVTIRFHPPTLNLMMFGRVSRARAVLTGRVRIGGPRPWLLPSFLRVFRTPS
ncbi:maleylpyruvate isomerase N-terminal domain-containing protein [Micromonospora sp. DR5-3]|uniref:maleylpyruvate isomerase N-terminal domain-containing protein n=1 Tax=unclassified Micromonospora TaxID=2617518 RepID=UPI002103E297|nr:MULTISPECIES: maleylpyruvate isomerase N-terminal domain-containing protein [unclassified Micromonospora]MCW3817266.1 maleylpyruvate isomerase N-terminal domain-containing protein [Micromonospora sp. DR5-3]